MFNQYVSGVHIINCIVQAYKGPGLAASITRELLANPDRPEVMSAGEMAGYLNAAGIQATSCDEDHSSHFRYCQADGTRGIPSCFLVRRGAADADRRWAALVHIEGQRGSWVEAADFDDLRSTPASLERDMCGPVVWFETPPPGDHVIYALQVNPD